VPDEFELFDVAPSERAARVREAIATLRAAWTGEPFEHRGRTVRILPRPAQPSGPPIMLGGSSEAAARRAARLADGFIPTESQWWTFYRDECLKLGKPDPGPGFDFSTGVVMLSEDPERAWDELGPYFLHETNSYGAWAAQAGVAAVYTPAADVAALREGDQYRILTPDEYAAELAPTGDAAFVTLHPMVGGIPPEHAWEHLRLFEETFL